MGIIGTGRDVLFRKYLLLSPVILHVGVIRPRVVWGIIVGNEFLQSVYALDLNVHSIYKSSFGIILNKNLVAVSPPPILLT